MASIQMTGMASGLDTKAIVESMLQTEKSKVDRINQDKQILEWRQELYREMITNVRNFTKKYFDPLNKETYIMGSSSLSGIKATTTTDSTVVGVLANNDAKPGNFELNVSQIAKPAKVTGTNVINQSTVKGELKIPIIIDETNDEITINGETIKIENKAFSSSTDLAKEINSKIQSSEKLKDKYKVEINDSGELEVSSKISITDENSKMKITANGVDYELELSQKSYTASELAKEIESKLKNSVGSDGEKFNNSDVKIEVKDGQVVIEGATSDKSFDFKTPTVSIENNSVSKSNKLEYTKGFISGKNSELVISVRGQEPVIVDLSDVDTSGTNEEVLKRVSDKINEKSTTVRSEVIDGKLVFKTDSKEQIIISGNAANSIGIGNSLDITLDINKEKMSNLLKFDDPDNKKVEFTINGKTFKYDFGATEDTDEYKAGKNLTVKQVFSDISSKAEVNISYNSISRSFSIESKSTGKEVSLEGSDVSGNFLNSLLGTNTLKAQGESAVVEFSDGDGNKNTFEFSSNNFTLSGINFDIKSMPTEPIKVSVVSDTDKTVELVKGFVEDFNEIMDDLNTKTKERKNSKYKPLTEAQKDEMTEKEIELWEKKAKEGILGNESEIENFMYQLRSAVFTPVEGVAVNLKDIGFDTSNDYREGGKIKFDEEKFRKALANDPQMISDIFTKISNSGYENYDPNLTAEQRQAKNADQGIFRRINDVLNDFTRITRNNDGKKGIFIEIAGISGDSTLNDNVISRAMQEHEKKIDRLNDLITRREERYYKQFTRMETALSKLQSQSSIFSY